MSEFAEIQIRIYKDGSDWCSVLSDFVDLQQSQAGFGNTPLEAVVNLFFAHPYLKSLENKI